MTPDVIDPPAEKPVDPPARRKTTRKTGRRKRASPRAVKAAKDELAGITARDCAAACTSGRCVISTVGICAHPYKAAGGSFGPVTTRNMEAARKRIKHQMVDMKG